jgi:hypothetical protein
MAREATTTDRTADEVMERRSENAAASPDRASGTDRAARSTADIAAAGAARDDGARRDRAESQAATGEAALFDDGTAHEYRERWLNIQTEFVDEPRGAVQKADALVAEVMTDLAETFARERKAMEHRWSGGEDTSTEDLRQTIRRYRSFFNRLLAV